MSTLWLSQSERATTLPNQPPINRCAGNNECVGPPVASSMAAVGFARARFTKSTAWQNLIEGIVRDMQEALDLNLIHLFTFYLAAAFLLSTVRRLRQYHDVAQLAFAAPIAGRVFGADQGALDHVPDLDDAQAGRNCAGAASRSNDLLANDLANGESHASRSLG